MEMHEENSLTEKDCSRFFSDESLNSAIKTMFLP